MGIITSKRLSSMREAVSEFTKIEKKFKSRIYNLLFKVQLNKKLHCIYFLLM
jgi:hypothetical protein